jgi:uncharacterized membrane protein YvbJ
MPRKKPKVPPPLFYCDGCGAEVSQDALACPKCGRKFTSIRCPVCGFSGEEDLFNDGCPKCGYQVLPGKGRHKNKRIASASGHGGKASSYPSTSGGGLPVWAYFLTIAFFILALSFLLFYMSH